MRKRYTKEFKVEALELAKQVGYAQAGRQLGISDNLIYVWKKKFNLSNDQDNSVIRAVADSEEVRELKRKILELEKINYILKRAAAFFSQDHLK